MPIRVNGILVDLCLFLLDNVDKFRSIKTWEDGLDDNIYSSLGKVIRARRDLLGLSQSALAAHTSMARTTITNIEAGGQNLMLHQFIVLAVALRISPEELLGQASKLVPLEPPQVLDPNLQNLLMKLDTPIRASQA